MAKGSKDWKEGYDAAIQAIKQSLSGSGNNGGQGSGLESLPTPGDAGETPQDGSMGQVTAEDCADPTSGGQLSNVPGRSGGMISREAGNQIAKAEGEEPDNSSDSSLEKNWKDEVMKNAHKMHGSGSANVIKTLENLYKVTKDWKKELKKIVGMSISPDEKRQAYANKNVLVSQNRIARTDKDRYDQTDYMMVWIDSSGSMTDDMLKQCLSEVYAVALAKKPIKLVIVQCDVKIQSIKEYKDLRELKKDTIHAKVKGGGGTDLKPCWELLATGKYSRRPCDLVMVFTDGIFNLTGTKRNPRTMKNLCWVILDNPSWEPMYKDMNTKVVRISTVE